MSEQNPVREWRGLGCLGPFELVERIGTGGFSETYLARLHGPDGFVKDVCLKRVLPEHAGDPDFVLPMRDEAVMQAMLSHPNVARVFDFREIDNQHVIVMEYVDGISLSALLRLLRGKRIQLPLPCALYVACKMLLALDSAHRLVLNGEVQLLIHRDISPKNILIDREGHPRLIDFGLVKAKHRAYRTQTGLLRGTFPYVAPETIMLGAPERIQQEDARTDVYGVGVVLYELLSARHPYVRRGISEFQMAPYIVKGEHRHLAEVAPDLPDGLADIVEGMMAANMDLRPATALAACLRLSPYLSSELHAQLELATLMGRVLQERPSRATGYTEPRSRSPEESGVQQRDEALAQASDPEAPAALPQSVLPDVVEAEAALPSTAPDSAPSTPETISAYVAKGPSRVTVAAVLIGAMLVAAALALRTARTQRVVPSTASAREQSSAPIEKVALPNRTEELDPETSAERQAEEPVLMAEPGVDAAAESVEQTETAKPGEAPTPKAAMLQVLVVPFGDVAIDGSKLGRAPINIQISPGWHTIRAGRTPKLAHRKAIRLRAGEQRDVVIDLDSNE